MQSYEIISNEERTISSLNKFLLAILSIFKKALTRTPML